MSNCNGLAAEVCSCAHYMLCIVQQDMSTLDNLLGTGPFIAMENFHYTAQFLGLPVQPTLEEIAAAGQHHCALAWPALQQKHGTNVSAEHLLHFCFRWSP